MKAVCGDEGLSYSTGTYWKRNFQTGHMSLTDEPRSGRHSLTDEIITNAYCSTLLNKLRGALMIKRHSMLTKGVRFLADNAPAHMSEAALMEARQCSYEILPHAAYSPDLAPSDFFLFQQMKTPLKGRRFDDTDEIIQELEQWFSMHSEDFYNDGMHSVKHRWEKCVTLDGDYVEKDSQIFGI